MLLLPRLLVVSFLLMLLLFPSSGMAALTTGLPSGVSSGLPFGGRIINAIPCSFGIIPAWHLTVANLTPTGFTFLWLPPPGTLTYLHGTPLLGRNIIGTSDAPLTCYILTPFGALPLPPAAHIQMEGTSFI